jgi:hypothetical protein
MVEDLENTMSTTASEHADNLDTAARLARAVAARFPDATIRVLWDDGRGVFIAKGVGANRVDVRVADKYPAIFRYVEVHVGDKSARVYEDQWYPRYVHTVLEDLRRRSPDVYATIVEEAGKS